MVLSRFVLALLALLALAPGTARAGWTEPATLASGDVAMNALVADSRGGLLAAWETGDSDWWAQATATGAFGPVESFAAAAPIAAAADGHGATHLTWRDATGVRYARRAADGSLDRRELVGATPFRTRPSIAADPAGNVAVAWRDYAEGRWYVRVAVRRADGAFGPPATLGDGRSVQDPAVALAPGGDVVVAWFHNGAPRAMQAAIGGLDGRFGAPVDLAPAGSVVAIQALAHPGGAVTVVWHEFGADVSVVRAARHAPGAAGFGDAAAIASGGMKDSDAINGIAAAALPDGWLLAYRLGQTVVAREVLGVEPGPVRTLDAIGPDTSYRRAPAAAVDARTGRGVVAWVDGDLGISARRRAADGSWGDPATLASGTRYAGAVQAAMGDDAAVAWNADSAVWVARFVAPPADGDGGPGGGGSGGGDPTPVVPSGDRTPPRVVVRLAPAIRTRRLVHVRVRCSEPCRVRFTGRLVHAGRPLASLLATRRLAERRTTDVALVLPPAARRALARHRALRLTLTVRARDAAGNARTVVRSAVLR